MPKIEYVEKNFRAESLALIAQINRIIADYERQGYSLTLRQVYYQLVARDVIPNTERSYKNIGNLISDARLAGEIDWDSIEDRTRMLRGNSHWETPEEIIYSAAESYHLDHWEGQRYYCEAWIEKDALVGVIERTCRELDVNFFSCRGYVSQSEMWNAAQRLINRRRHGHEIILFHLGDHDPSGKDMSRDIVDRLYTFGLEEFLFQRIALNMDQIEAFNPPPNPTKVTDTRASAYISEFGHDCWELDALPPPVINDILRDHILDYRDPALYGEIIEKEKNEIALLKEFAKNHSAIQDNWLEIEKLISQRK